MSGLRPGILVGFERVLVSCQLGLSQFKWALLVSSLLEAFPLSGLERSLKLGLEAEPVIGGFHKFGCVLRWR